jgi:hypothetical protein
MEIAAFMTVAGAICFAVYMEIEKRRYLRFLDSINDEGWE